MPYAYPLDSDYAMATASANSTDSNMTINYTVISASVGTPYELDFIGVTYSTIQPTVPLVNIYLATQNVIPNFWTIVDSNTNGFVISLSGSTTLVNLNTGSYLFNISTSATL